LVNGWVSWHAYKFWKYGGERGSARGLFFASLVSLPAVLILAMLHKNGLWDWLWEKDIEEATAETATAVEVEGNIGQAVEI
jgi:protoheme IX farnesyltransferase